MLCELCTMETVKGTMYRFRTKNYNQSVVICSDCRYAITSSEAEYVNEPICACGKMQKWLCDAAIKAPCKPDGVGRNPHTGKTEKSLKTL